MMVVIHANVTQDIKVMVLHVLTSTNAALEHTIATITLAVQTSTVPSHAAVMLVMPETVKTVLISMNVPPMVITVMPMRLVQTLMAASLVVATTDTPEMELFAVM